jgi:uncharacterized protein
MKWLLLADLQGVKYQDWMNFISSPIDCDIVVTLGDIDPLFLKSIAERFSNKLIIGVLGNHDLKGDLKRHNIVNLHGKCQVIGNYRVIGIEGCVRYKNAQNVPLYTQEEIISLCEKMPKADIVISHNSPFYIHDKNDEAHEGYIGLHNYIKEHQPKYVFHGHQHIHRVTKYGKTLVIGIYGGMVWNQKNDTFNQVLYVTD